MTTCTGCDEECTAEDGYSDCCNEPVTSGPLWGGDDDGWDRSGVSDGRSHVVSDADPGL